MASCWVIEEPPCTTPPAWALVEQRARGAGEVDAEMLVEAPVLGREHRLDQVVGKLVERDRIVVPDAAGADLVAVAVEEGDRELGLLQPVVVGGLAERRAPPAPASAPGRRRRAWRPPTAVSTSPAPPAGDVEAVHEGGEPLVDLAQPEKPSGTR